MDEERMTLVPSCLAKKGFRFIPMGHSSNCSSCKYRSTCIDGMEIGRVYEVIEVNERKRFPCPVHGEVVLSSVRRARVEVAMTMSPIEGASISYKPIECSDLSCPNYWFCRPEGLKPGDKLVVIRELGEVECAKFSGVKLYEVEVK